jgi:hypothetical protein
MRSLMAATDSQWTEYQRIRSPTGAPLFKCIEEMASNGFRHA